MTEVEKCKNLSRNLEKCQFLKRIFCVEIFFFNTDKDLRLFKQRLSRRRQIKCNLKEIIINICMLEYFFKLKINNKINFAIQLSSSIKKNVFV